MEKKILAYLDLLGFKSFIEADQEGAFFPLDNIQMQLVTRLVERKIHPPRSYPNSALRKLAQSYSVNSFEYFLPFSDSLIIISNRPSLFIRQLATLLVACFKYSAYEYKHPLKPEDPVKVMVKHIIQHEDGTFEKQEKEHSYFPALFKGGIVFDDVAIAEVISILHYKARKVQNALGRAVVKAVQLERNEEKGPRIFIEAHFLHILKDNSIRCLLIPAPNGTYELLWPAFLYKDTNSPALEILEFDTMFKPAVNLWKAYNHLSASIVYFNFLRLVVKSTLIYFAKRKFLGEAEKYIVASIRREGLDTKKAALLN